MATSNDLICEAGREYRQNRRTRDSNQGKLRAGLKKYGDQGVNTKALTRMIGMAGRMTPEEVVKQLTDELHYARLFMRLDLSGADLLDGLDTQVTNSTRHADDVMSAESRGFQDGRMGKTRDDCPYSDPELIQSWRKWWKNGVEQRAVEQPGSKMKSVPRGRKGRQTRMEGTEATQDSPRRAMRRSKKAKRKQRSDAGQKRGPRKMRNTPQVVDFPHAAQ